MAELDALGSDPDPAALRRVFGCFPTGVAAICAVVAGTPVGMAVGSFTSVSLRPPLVSVCIDRASSTWPVLRGAPVLGISVLSREHELVGRRLSSRDGDRFHGVPTERSERGALYVAGATAHLECAVQDELPAGDHHIVLLHLSAIAARPDTTPLVFHRSAFHGLAVAHRTPTSDEGART